MASATQHAMVLRTATPEDAVACGQICFAAFAAISGAHSFPCDLPSPEAATGLLAMMFSHPGFHCIVAEVDGRIVGSNCLDKRSPVFGVGPITVDPAVQNAGVGRKLMEAVMEHSSSEGATGVRLVQAAFHMRSLSLYASLGFEVRELLCCMQGRTIQREMPGCRVRPATALDADPCCALSLRVHGFDRRRELADAIESGTALVVERAGSITGYASILGFFGHAIAASSLDMMALIASADGFAGPGILVPARETSLLQWGLTQGLRIVQPMTLMSTGFYQEPAGAWLPSIVF